MQRYVDTFRRCTRIKSREYPIPRNLSTASRHFNNFAFYFHRAGRVFPPTPGVSSGGYIVCIKSLTLSLVHTRRGISSHVLSVRQKSFTQTRRRLCHRHPLVLVALADEFNPIIYMYALTHVRD